MEWIEVTARTIEEAKELALDRLGVVEDELDYEVVEEPRAGLFGIGRTDARIRARVKPLSREKPGDRRRRRDRTTRPRDGAGASRATTGAGGRAAAGETPAPRRRRARRRSRAAPARGNEPAEASTGTESREAHAMDEATLSVDEQARAAARFAEDLVARFGLRGDVAIRVVDDEIELRVDGDGLGVLVGPRGVTLQALEELVRAVVQHAADGRSARLHLDVGGYRERRRAALAEFATRIAHEVRESGAARALEPMLAGDRKVVHDAVAGLDGVATTSEGVEPRRWVVIRPE